MASPRIGRQRACVAYVLVALGSAGCAASPSPAGLGGPGGPAAGAAAHDASTGALTGLVVTEDFLPLPGAELLLRPGSNTTRAATDGRYAFSYLAPGNYTVHASAAGYRAASAAVVIAAGGVTARDLRLGEARVVEPRSDVVGPYEGYLRCATSTRLSTGSCGFLPVVGSNPVSDLTSADDRNLLEFGLEADDWQEIVFEARWRSGAVATSPRMTMFFSYDGRPETHWFADSGDQKSPLRFAYVRGAAGPGGQILAGQPVQPDLNMTLNAQLQLPFGSYNSTNPADSQLVGVAYELRYQAIVTVFYSWRAPGGFSAFADA